MNLKEKSVWTADAESSVLQITRSQEFRTTLKSFCDNNLRNDPVDSCVDTLNHMINEALKRADVIRPIKMTEADTKEKKPDINNKWFDHECKTEKANLVYIGRQACKFPNDKNIISLLANKKRIFRRTIRRKKRSFERNQIKALQDTVNAGNQKLFWEKLKRIFKNTKNEKDNNFVTTDEFYNHFSNLNESTVEPTRSRQYRTVINNDHEKGPLDFTFTEEELDKAIKKLKSNKSPGPDNIPNEFLKVTKTSFLPALVMLFNKILESGNFPRAWAYGHLIPIHKKGEKDNPENYRGITLLSCLGKVFTSALNKRLLDYIEVNNILQPEQAGFRGNCRTSDNIFILKAIIDKYVKGKPKKKENYLFTCFVDLKKAFDKIDRERLFIKLNNAGINGHLLSVIKSIYSKDESCIRNGNEISKSFCGNVGIKQGCILSPTLFNIYMHDFPKTLNVDDNDAP